MLKASVIIVEPLPLVGEWAAIKNARYNLHSSESKLIALVWSNVVG